MSGEGSCVSEPHFRNGAGRFRSAESGWNHHRVSVRLMPSLLSARLSAPAWGHSALEWSVVCFQLLPVGTELNLTTTSSLKPSALSSRFSSYPVVCPWFPFRVPSLAASHALSRVAFLW